MRLRATLFLNGRESSVQLYPALEEPDEHQLLKFAAAIFFAEQEPTAEMGATHPALQGQDYWPDLLKTNLMNEVTIWVECGKTTPHKLEKVSKRFRGARVIVLTALPHQARQQADDVKALGLKNVEVWSFREGEFARWCSVAGERNDVVGEADERSMNLVINDQAFMTELDRIYPDA